MKFRGHETFSIRKGWLNKGLRAVKESNTIFVDKQVNPMDVLGIGSNMVKALRYWLQVSGLTQEGVKGLRGQQITSLGNLIFENDPYFEEIGTLWIVHYNIVKNLNMATSWYYFFNLFSMTEFEKEDFVSSITNWAKIQGIEVSTRSIEDDFNCLINTYLPKYKVNSEKSDPESNMESPLAELGLIDISRGKNKAYVKSTPLSRTIDPLIAVAIILDNACGKKEILLSDLLNGENSIGRVFNLDVMELLAVLDAAQQTGLISVVRTAGLDVVKIETKMQYIECIKQFYENLF